MKDMVKNILLAMACVCVNCEFAMARVNCEHAMSENNVHNASMQNSVVSSCNECDKEDKDTIDIKVGRDKLITSFKVYQNDVDVTSCFMMGNKFPKDNFVNIIMCCDGNVEECKFDRNDSIKFVFEYFDGLTEEVFIPARKM